MKYRNEIIHNKASEIARLHWRSPNEWEKTSYDRDAIDINLSIINPHDFDENYGYRPPMDANIYFSSAKEAREFAQKILDLLAPKPEQEREQIGGKNV